VCAPLYKYSEIYSVFQENGVIYSSDSLKFNGVHNTENKSDSGSGSGSVSFFQLPSRGSYARFSNDGKGNSVFGINTFDECFPYSKFKPDQNGNQKDNCNPRVHNLRAHIDECFEQVFSSIGPRRAAIWPFKGFDTNMSYFEQYKCNKYIYKCISMATISIIIGKICSNATGFSFNNCDNLNKNFGGSSVLYKHFSGTAQNSMAFIILPRVHVLPFYEHFPYFPYLITKQVLWVFRPGK
jgi:hypothetical protein